MHGSALQLPLEHPNGQFVSCDAYPQPFALHVPGDEYTRATEPKQVDGGGVRQPWHTSPSHNPPSTVTVQPLVQVSSCHEYEQTPDSQLPGA